MQDAGHVVDGASGMQVCGLAYDDTGVSRGNIVKGKPGLFGAALGFRVDGNGGFTTRGGCAAARLVLDQFAHAGAAITDNFCRFADGAGNDTVIDDDETQIDAGNEFLDDHIITNLLRLRESTLDVAPPAQINRNAFALLTPN